MGAAGSRSRSVPQAHAVRAAVQKPPNRIHTLISWRRLASTPCSRGDGCTDPTVPNATFECLRPTSRPRVVWWGTPSTLQAVWCCMGQTAANAEGGACTERLCGPDWRQSESLPDGATTSENRWNRWGSPTVSVKSASSIGTSTIELLYIPIYIHICNPCIHICSACAVGRARCDS